MKDNYENIEEVFTEMLKYSVDEAFKYLKKEVPDYKKNKYYKKRGLLKRTIEKNKTLTKLYLKLHRNK